MNVHLMYHYKTFSVQPNKHVPHTRLVQQTVPKEYFFQSLLKNLLLEIYIIAILI